MIPNVRAAIVVKHLHVANDDQAVAYWPNQAIDCERLLRSLPLLKAQLSPVVTMGKQLPTDNNISKKSHDTLIIAYPLSFCADSSGAVILEVEAKITQQAVLLQMLKWGQSWLQLLLNNIEKTGDTIRQSQDALKEKPDKSNQDQTKPIPLNYLAIIQAILSCTETQQANMTLVNEVSRCWPFDRVSLGIVKGNDIEVKALSHSAHFDQRSNLVVSLQQAMMEVKDRSEGRCFLSAEVESLNDYPEHQRLLLQYENNALISIPLKINAQTIAILLCEFQSQYQEGSKLSLSASEQTAKEAYAKTLSTQELSNKELSNKELSNKEQLDHDSTYQNAVGKNTDSNTIASKYLTELTLLASLLGPLVGLHQRGSQSIPAQVMGRSHAYLSRLNQGRFGKLPLVFATFFLLLMTFVVDGDFRVSSEATLEGRIQLAVVAPFDGYIDTAFARAGEQVEKGELLAQLDDRPLQLEKRGWLSKKEEYQKQYRQELATLSHAKSRIIKAQIAQADIHIDQADNRLQRAKLLSPLSGIIIEGDLSRSLGAPVEQGQVLFEVAPLDDYRVVLKIHERDIAYLQTGQKGSLMLTAYPNHSIPFTIEQVAIVYQQEGDYTWYRTEASLSSTHLPNNILLRPGMAGLGKIDVGQKSLAWIGLHRLTDWLRLWFWSWTP